MQSLKITAENLVSVNWEDEYYKYCEFSDFSIEGGYVTSDFANCTFTNIDWYWGHFSIINFVECVFVKCLFRGIPFDQCRFVDSEIRECKFLMDNLGGDCSFDGTVAYNCVVLDSEGFNPRFVP